MESTWEVNYCLWAATFSTLSDVCFSPASCFWRGTSVKIWWKPVPTESWANFPPTGTFSDFVIPMNVFVLCETQFRFVKFFFNSSLSKNNGSYWVLSVVYVPDPALSSLCGLSCFILIKALTTKCSDPHFSNKGTKLENFSDLLHVSH